jgi:hypothetical protein
LKKSINDDKAEAKLHNVKTRQRAHVLSQQYRGVLRQVSVYIHIRNYGGFGGSELAEVVCILLWMTLPAELR